MPLRGGVDALLTTLVPAWRRQSTALRPPSRPAFDVPLCGRGLPLVPSLFATGPFVGYRPDDPTVPVYPMHDGAGTTDASADALHPAARPYRSRRSGGAADTGDHHGPGRTHRHPTGRRRPAHRRSARRRTDLRREDRRSGPAHAAPLGKALPAGAP
ncbi:hypothetical protein [Streptomyces caelestis]|uniref:hypothetical protein n=1 Tax=Streptomyces caelestis TaxID=36816 RepID=UPI003650EA5A